MKKPVDEYPIKGWHYNHELCAELVQSGQGWWQCSRKRGHGPRELFCKQHSRRFAEGKTETWYCVFRSNKIQPVDVTSYTDNYVWIDNGQISVKEARRGRYSSYFPTKEQAINSVRIRLQTKIESAQQTITEAEQQLKELET